MKALSDDQLLDVLSRQCRFAERTETRCQTQLLQLYETADRYEATLLESLSTAKTLKEEQLALVSTPSPPRRDESFRKITLHADETREVLSKAFREFEIGDYRYLLPNAAALAFCNGEVRRAWEDLTNRFDTHFKPDTTLCIAVLEEVAALVGRINERTANHEK